MSGLPDLHGTRRRYRGVLLVELQAGILPWQFQVLDELAGVGLEVTSRVLVGDVQEAPREAFAPERHHARYYHLMALWRERFPGRFLDIAYEDTARDLEPNARALIEYLELPWEDACLQFHKQDAAVTTASAVQVREPAHTRSIGRWRRYESQLAVMRETLLEQGVPIGE